MATDKEPTKKAATAAAPSAPAGNAGPRVKWNVEQLKSSYVNFANANSTRESSLPLNCRLPIVRLPPLMSEAMPRCPGC